MVRNMFVSLRHQSNQNTHTMPRQNHRYIFTFEGGGWNTVMATNVRSARKIAREKYADSDTLNPMPDSFNRITPDRYRIMCID